MAAWPLRDAKNKSSALVNAALAGKPQRVRTAAKQFRRQPWDDGDHPAYIFIEPSIGYRMEKAEGTGDGTRHP